jgi:hypothetical protein
MEAPLLLGAGVWLANALISSPIKNVDMTKEEYDVNMIENPRDFLMHQMREAGAIAPSYNHVPARVPWDSVSPPYYIKKHGGTHLDNPTENYYTLWTNSFMHQLADVTEAFARNRPSFARQHGGAIWNAFNMELYQKDIDGPYRGTGNQGFFWLPKNPADQDYNDAAALAKALPPDPLLFTPDAYFATAPGLPFRYAPY